MDLIGLASGVGSASLGALKSVITKRREADGVFDVADHGLRRGSSGRFSCSEPGLAAANAAALAALWVKVAAAGGGRIQFGAGWWPLAPVTLDHGYASSWPISIEGMDGATCLLLCGTTGPFLNVAPLSTQGAVNYGVFRNLQIYHADGVTSGETLRFGNVGNYTFENIRSIFVDPGLASLVAVQLHLHASALKFVNCKFTTRTDESLLAAQGLSPVGLDVAQTQGQVGALEFVGTEFSGCQNRSTGIRFANYVGIDTVTFAGSCLVKDHQAGIRFGVGADNGGVSNLVANGIVLDGITGVSVHYAPVGHVVVANHTWAGSWMSGNQYLILIDGSGWVSGETTLRNVVVSGSYLSGGAWAAIAALGTMKELTITGNKIRCDTNGSGRAGLDFGDGVNPVSDLVVSGNQIDALMEPLAGAVIRASAQCGPLAISGNGLRGSADTTDGIDIAGPLSASRVVAGNSYAP